METEAVYIDKVEAVGSIRLYSQIGRRAALHCTSVGKALLSGLSSGDLAEMVRRLPMSPAPPYADRSRGTAPPDRRGARTGLGGGRHGERNRAVLCVGAPIRDYRDQVIAAVSTSGPATVLTPDRDAAVARHVMEAAGRSPGAWAGWNRPINAQKQNAWIRKRLSAKSSTSVWWR
jgi:DNA-binding IclR family transcriptional regulator